MLYTAEVCVDEGVVAAMKKTQRHFKKGSFEATKKSLSIHEQALLLSVEYAFPAAVPEETSLKLKLWYQANEKRR